MGEMADYMIQGNDCQGCGHIFFSGCRFYAHGFGKELLTDDGKEWGSPRHCVSCGPIDKQASARSKAKKVRCPECLKRVHPAGLEQHIAAKHPKSSNES